MAEFINSLNARNKMALGTPSWLNQDFVERVLRRSEADESIRVIDIFVKPATNKGDNYTSDMLRATVEFSRQQGDKRITEKISIIVKIAPQAEGMRKDLISKGGFFGIEMDMMTNTLTKMNKLLGHSHRLSARALYVQREDPVLLVLEDLAPYGYRMADRQAGLDLAHCLLAIKNLAKFHASSVAVYEKEPKVKKMYNSGMFNMKYPAQMRGFFVQGAKTLAAEISTWPDLDSKYSQKIKEFSDIIYEKGCEAAVVSEDEFNVINHGDFWVNNMLFRYNDDGKPIDHIFVDFQLALYGSPAIDLLYFLNTSPSIEVYNNNRNYLLEEYHKVLSSTMKQLGCSTAPPTIEALQKQLRKRASIGMIASFTVLPLVLIDRSEVKDLDEIMSKDGTYDNPAYRGKLYRNTISARIPVFEQMGLLDV